MELKEIRKETKKMLSNFLNEIGLDGEYYSSICNCPMKWEKNILGVGKYLEPGSGKLEKIIQTSGYNEKEREILNQRGLIILNQNYRQKEDEPELLVTAIHENIHSNRNLLLFDATRDNKNEKAYTFNNNKFEQNISDYSFSDVDASQEVLKGNIDTSQTTIDSYKNINSKELEDMKSSQKKIGSQMKKQKIVDEALVELIAILSYKLYNHKEKGEPADIWQEIEKAKEIYEGEDIGAMSKIILKHHDFELFKWMIDPISYSQGDIHYDFFGKYTKNDQALLQELYESKGLDLESAFLEMMNRNKIGITSIEEMGGWLSGHIKPVQNCEKNEYERY